MMSTHWRTVSLKVLALAVLLVTVVSMLMAQRTPRVSAAQVMVGRGSYNTTLPAGRVGPQGPNGSAAVPRVTGAAVGRPVPTNDWWTSLLWQRGTSTYGEPLFAHPLSLRASATGMGVGYSASAGIGTEFHYGHNLALTLGVAGLNAPDVKVANWSDWTVTAQLAGGGATLNTTFGHGLPFVYATKTGGNATITTNGTPTIFAGAGTNVVGLNIGGRFFGIFAPAGATWSQSGSVFSSSLGGKSYFSVAVLPDGTAATLSDFAQYAFNVVTDTQLSWRYDQPTARSIATYSAITTAHEGTASGTLLALYRHQWINSSSVNTTYTYASPRGQMKVVRGGSFQTSMVFNGVLPSLPDMGTYNRTTLAGYINEVEANMGFPALSADTYWTGKGLGRLAILVRIAEQVGDITARDLFLNTLKGRLEAWFQAPDGKTTAMFHYNSQWGTLIGYPASYGSDESLNDHHFHYGYYIFAAATIAQYDPVWAQDANWGGMVKLLIRDAGSWLRNDTMFPYMRNYDIYEGHGWAAGHAAFATGNNNESSSEGMLFNTGILLWGAATGDTTLRDYGIHLYTTEQNAIEQYWWDIDNLVFPSAFNYNAVGMVWGDGGAHATWFSGAPEMIHGINFLPVQPGSLYMGRRPSYVRANYDEIVRENGGAENEWVDIIWQYLALQDPALAVTKFGTGAYTPEAGDSKAHTYHWIHNLNGMGQLDTSVTANIPTYNVFVKNGVRTYVAYNPGSSATTVSFSDGTSCTVASRSMFAGQRSACAAGPTPTTGPSATSTRTSTTGPTNTAGPSSTTAPSRTSTSTSVPTTCGTTNVAQGKPATSSAVQGANTPNLAVDGNNGTRWESVHGVDPGWIRIDLGSVQNICRVSINWEGAYASAYRIEVSNDGTAWTTLRSLTGQNGGVDDNTGLTGSGRYVRIYGTTRGTIYGYSIWELQIYTGGNPPATNTPTRTNTQISNPPATNTPTRTNTQISNPATNTPTRTRTNTVPPAGCGSSNVALSKPATSSSNENAGTPPTAAVDGNTGTRWASGFSDPQWIRVDLGSTQSICRVVLRWEAAFGRAYQIQTSNDGAAWTTIYSTTTGDGGVDDLANLNGAGRYIRMNGTTRATQYGYSLWEFEVYSGACCTTPPTATRTATSGTTPPTVTPVSNSTFWGDYSGIPAANNVLTLKFLNRTNGKYPDSQIYWSFNGVTRSIAEAPYFDMPANSAGRMNFYLGAPNSQYTDFIEFTVGPDAFHGNTTRVDWFGIKVAMKIRGHNGTELQVGEDLQTFQEDRAVTFQKFIDEVPAEFKHLAQSWAPYRIPAPGKMGDTAFTASGQYANYMQAYAQSVGVNASIFDILACAGSLANNPQMCAALNRHVAHLPLADQRNPANFYQAAPANYYSKFWHDHSIDKKSYGFPYDDYAEQAAFFSMQDPQYLLVAIGW